MSYEAIIVNNYITQLTIIPLEGNTPQQSVQLPKGQSVPLTDINNGDGFVIRTNEPITVKYDSSDLTKAGRVIYPTGSGDFPTYKFIGAGKYTIYSDGDNYFDGDVSPVDVINAILTNPCQWNNYSNVLYQGPWNAAWGNNSPCEFDQFVLVCGMLNKLLFNKSRDERLRILNEPIITPYLPPYANDGTGRVTMLEAAVIVVWPALVVKLLSMGADPNVTTNPYGQTILVQLLLEQANGTYYYDWADNQAIVDALLKAGAWVPPYFPGTAGYIQGYGVPPLPGPIPEPYVYDGYGYDDGLLYAGGKHKHNKNHLHDDKHHHENKHHHDSHHHENKHHHDNHHDNKHYHDNE